LAASGLILGVSLVLLAREARYKRKVRLYSADAARGVGEAYTKYLLALFRSGAMRGAGENAGDVHKLEQEYLKAARRLAHLRSLLIAGHETDLLADIDAYLRAVSKQHSADPSPAILHGRQL